MVEPFSPGHNVVVGRNGSGKSNFFAAIRFVLNDAYVRLGQEERQALLHEGSGQPSISAFVEVVFDNADGRFPTGRDEVVLRRTIGLKKDEYSLDRRTVTKTDVMNLLQAAGFSKANPYYIVPQGRITALTNARDNERLELLKEVAGTRVYEEHRQESLRIMEETEGKRAKIVELLEYIAERLKELAEEKEELLRWQGLDKQKRACEFALYSREQNEAQEALDRLEEEYRSQLQGVGADNDVVMDGSRESATDQLLSSHLSAIEQLEKDLLDARASISEAKRDVEACAADVEEARQSKAHLAAALASSKEETKASTGQVGQLRTQLQRLEGELVRKEQELSQLQPLQLDAATEEETCQRELSQLQATFSALQAKQGRASQFSTAAERDRWLKQEIGTIETTQKLQQGQAMDAEATLNATNERIGTLQAQAQTLEQAQTESKAREQECLAALQEAKKARDVATDARKELWRAEGKIETALSSISEQISQSERTVQSSMDLATWQGLDAVQRLSESLNLADQVYGPVYQLFTVADDLFRPAAEAIAGTSLFQIVVANEEVATQLLKGLQKERAGRVTFVPLNRLRIRQQKSLADSDDESDAEGSATAMEVDLAATFDDPNEAIPLMSKIECTEERFRPLISSIFGQAIVVPSLSPTIMAKARRAHCTALTLSGDRADRRGTLSGGYRDPRASRLDALIRLQQWKRRRAEHEALLADLKTRLAVADQHVTRTVATVVNLEQQLSSGAGSRRVLDQMEALLAEISSARDIAGHQQARLRALKEDLVSLQVKQSALQEEIGQPLRGKLSAEAALQLSEAPAALDKLKKQAADAGKRRAEICGRVSVLEQLLAENLRKRRLALLTQLAALSPAESRLMELETQYKAVGMQVIDAEKRLKDAEGRLNAAEDALRQGEVALEKSKVDGEAVARACDSNAAVMERFLSRRSLLVTRRDEAAKRVRELGVIAEDAYERFRDLTPSALMASLSDLTATIKSAFSAAPVNRKAAEQHATFLKQAEALNTRQQELDASAAAIRSFVGTLDRRKEEAIMRTFAQVQSNFERVFERLCPTGRAQLMMLRELEGDEEASAAPSMTMTGIAIRASFSSKNEGEGLLTSQLSGGQKSLLALALIFAIQLVDPAPFYLFDEIDANLDAAARSAVASLISTLSKSSAEAGKLGGENARQAPPAQFILTTFRPEMVKEADAFFGVTFAQRVSRVDQISAEEALQFIEHEATVTI